MAVVREATLIALGKRVENFQAVLNTALKEKFLAERVFSLTQDETAMEYIGFLDAQIVEIEPRLRAAKITLEKAREARVTGRLQ